MSLIENLVFKRGDFSIDIPIWEIPDQGVSVLSGPSGSGKSTIFRILLGLIPCPSLKWTIKGIDLAKLQVSEKKLGVVFQSYDLFPHMSGRENILFAAEARHLSGDETNKALAKLSNTLNMGHFINRKVGLCSGGEKQRIALARALIGNPRVLLLDEPFSALDENLKEEARLLVKSLIQEFKIPTILITHDDRDIKSMGDKVYSLSQGRLVTL